MSAMDEFQKKVSEIVSGVSGFPKQPAKGYKCPACKDMGWIPVTDSQGYPCLRECRCMAMEKAKCRLERSGISREFTAKSFDNFDTRDIGQLVTAVNKAKCYCRDFLQAENTRHNSIIFSGQSGAGKTHLGMAICNWLLGRQVAVVYMEYRNAVTKLKQQAMDGQAYQGGISRYSSARVLYIDDLLKGKATESDVNILYEIVNYRYMNNLPMVISTEKSLEELMEFDEAIGGRIIEMCIKSLVTLKGKELNYRF